MLSATEQCKRNLHRATEQIKAADVLLKDRKGHPYARVRRLDALRLYAVGVFLSRSAKRVWSAVTCSD
jgi:hypothetical protein